jgi:putative ABC transport system permease protein
MKPWWHVQGDKPSFSHDLLLGAQTARQLDKSAGDRLVIKDKEFRVAGVLEEQFSTEDQAIFADLRETGMLFDKRGKVSFIEVSTWCAECPVETIVEQISAKLPHARVFAVKQLVEAELSQVRLVASFAVVLTAVVLVVGSLIMLLTMMASVRERIQEIGILRTIGFRQYHIMKLILIEGITISLISSCFGAIIGNLAAMVLYDSFGGLGISFPPDLRFIGISVALSIVMGTLPTVYSARKAAQLDPATALRAI